MHCRAEQAKFKMQVESIVHGDTSMGQREFPISVFARLRHPDAVFFRNMAPVIVLSGPIQYPFEH